MSSETKTIWHDAKTDFPPFEKDVIGFYILPEDTDEQKETKQIFEYYVICRVRSITESLTGKSAEWILDDYSTVDPLFWCEKPESPLKLKSNE